VLFDAKTYGELDALVADLPVPSSPDRARLQFPRWLSAAGATTLLLTVLGMLTAVGHHSGDAFVEPRSGRHLDVPGPLPESHHLIVEAASTVAVFVMLAVLAAGLWLVRSTRAPDS
jgi:hypothetical protein